MPLERDEPRLKARCRLDQQSADRLHPLSGDTSSAGGRGVVSLRVACPRLGWKGFLPRSLWSQSRCRSWCVGRGGPVPNGCIWVVQLIFNSGTYSPNVDLEGRCCWPPWSESRLSERCLCSGWGPVLRGLRGLCSDALNAFRCSRSFTLSRACASARFSVRRARCSVRICAAGLRVATSRCC